MSSNSAEEIFLKDLTQTELEEEKTTSLLQKMYKEGGSFTNVLDLIHSQMLPQLKKDIETLSSVQSQSKEKLFFSCKQSIQEAEQWLKLALRVYFETAQTNALDAPLEERYRHTQALFQQLERDVDGFAKELLLFRKEKLYTDLNGSIEAIVKEMNFLLFSHLEMQKRVELIHYHISKNVFKKIKEYLSTAQSFILKHRDTWEKQTLQSGRNLYIHHPSEFPYPLIYTTEGRMYIIQEVVEHFVGVGASKYVSRTFEMQEGKVRALIRPKKKYPDTMSEFEKTFLKQYNFEQSIVESKFLRLLREKKGIITQYEALVFKNGEEKNLYQVCELFDSQDLFKLLGKILNTQNPIQLSHKELVEISRDLLQGLDYIHQAGIIHRDIKYTNILVHLENPSQEAQARIIDFNVACFKDDTEQKTEAVVSMFAPPEFCTVMYETQALLDARHIPVTTQAMDVWAMGCILYAVFFRAILPWDKDIENPQYFSSGVCIDHTIRVSLLQEGWISQEYHSHTFYPLIEAMLKVDPRKRITASEALSFFEKLAPSFLEKDF